MKSLNYILLIICFPMAGLLAQSNSLSTTVSLDYDQAILGEVLSDLSRNYDINFSYSSDYIPLRQLVTCTVKNRPLYEALDQLFYDTDIVYRMIGDQVVLKIDEDKRIGRIEEELEKQFNPILYDEMEEIKTEQELAKLMPEIPEQISLEHEMMAAVDMPAGFDYSEGVASVKMTDGQANYAMPKDFKASFSVVPKVAAAVGGSKEAPSNTSVNLIYGKTENVEGVEIGCFVNEVTNDVKGVQVSGLVNMVAHDVEGVQFGGTVNVVDNDVRGLQASGLVNVVGGSVSGADLAKKGEYRESVGVQLAGLVNVVDQRMDGVQLAGIGNVVGEDAEGVQVAGLFNTNKGDTDIQVSSIFNHAKYVKNTQIGLVNVCDSIGGVSVGLVNIVKGGMNSYNRAELGTSLLFDLTTGLKFGTYKFYNQVKFSGEFIGSNKAWGLGYGLGTSMKMSPRSLVNLEILAMQINEDGFWTNDLNLLNQIHLSFDYKISKNASFYAGPTLNILVSNRQDTEGNYIGSALTPYAISLDPGGDDAERYVTWVGFNAGFRF